MSIWCDHIDRMLPEDEVSSTEEEKATTAAQLEATTEMKAQALQRVWRQKKRHQQRCRQRQGVWR